MAANDIGVLPEGRRNDGLTRLAGALRRKGASQQQIEEELFEANQRRCQPPLPGEEVCRIAASVAGYPAGGPDPLKQAWDLITSRAHTSNYARFLALARQLQIMRPGQPVALPVERIAELLRCHYTMVGIYRKQAIADGALQMSSKHVAHRRASTYYVKSENEEQRVPSETLTNILSNGLVRVPSENHTPSPSESPREQQILRLATRTFQLFPCRGRDKTPLVKWRTQASSDPDRLRQWEKRFPSCNWAVATGEGSGIFVLDIDAAKGLSSFVHRCEEVRDDWKRIAASTLGVKTGRGVHLYFRHPNRQVRNSASDLGEGLDIRGDGGYVIAPPSVHASGDAYTWLGGVEDKAIRAAPQWLLELAG